MTEDEEKTFKSLKISAELHRRFKTSCSAAGMSMMEVAEEVIRNWVEKEEAQTKKETRKRA